MLRLNETTYAIEGCTSSDLKEIAKVIQAHAVDPHQTLVETPVIRFWITEMKRILPWWSDNSHDATATCIRALALTLANSIAPVPVPKPRTP